MAVAPSQCLTFPLPRADLKFLEGTWQWYCWAVIWSSSEQDQGAVTSQHVGTGACQHTDLGQGTTGSSQVTGCVHHSQTGSHSGWKDLPQNVFFPLKKKFFFFWQLQRHVEIPGPGIKPALQQ